MDKEWSEKNKEIQKLLGKEATFHEGIRKLIDFRAELMEEITSIVRGYPAEAFYAMPFPNANGYHSKTLAYSMWHIFRIEDITAHELTAGDAQVFFRDGFDTSLKAPLITTGNELKGEKIAEFSKQLDIAGLYRYIQAVASSTNEILLGLSYQDAKRKFTDADREKLHETGCISEDENAVWLIGYWCGKDVMGLIKMPFSRHWIMHIEAMRRIKNRLCRLARKGVDPIAYCGFSCNHCFLSESCGSCRTAYNTCSFAAASPDGICPNVSCCREKGIDGCYECAELETCVKGFYVPSCDGAQAAKAQAMFIRKHGKKAFLKAQDRLHESYEFLKTQEVLGQDMYEGLKILEAVREP